MNTGISDTELTTSTVDRSGDVFVGSNSGGDIYESTDQGAGWSKIATLGYPVRSLFMGGSD